MPCLRSSGFDELIEPREASSCRCREWLSGGGRREVELGRDEVSLEG